MKKLAFMALVAVLLIGCTGLENQSVEPGRDYCIEDKECILKPEPYCCGGKAEFIDRCYFANDFPERINCDGYSACPGLVNTIGCKCENNNCVDVYGF